MVPSTNTQLGKLLASYLSTSNDALAIHFRKHYSPTISPTSPRKPKAKRPTPRLTTATFTYRWLATAPQRITTLYQYLLRATWIASDTNPDDFFSLFTGEESNARIKWIGSNLQLAYLIRIMTEQNYISTPKHVGKWTCVYNHFVDKNNCQLRNLNALHIPIKSKIAVQQMAEILNPNRSIT
jgi:hypothetical protein